jgi:glycosyltransferase involved in cell wall biosynthesis
MSSYTLEGCLRPSMPPFTALLHTANSALRLGRALETLLPCAEVLIVDHNSTDATLRIAREHGARIVPRNRRSTAYFDLEQARYDWILCLDPSESITEALQATLFEWSLMPVESTRNTSSFSCFVREQIAGNWHIQPASETRLVPRNWTRWNGLLPAYDPSSSVLEGELVRLAYP